MIAKITLESMKKMRIKLDNVDVRRYRYDRSVPPPTQLAYRMRTLGRVRGAAYHSTRGTYHDDAMLTVFLTGRGVYLQGKRRQALKAGMVGLVLPTEQPGILMADPDEPYDHFYCRFAGHEALTVAQRIRAEHGGPPFVAAPNWSTIAEHLRSALPADSDVSQLTPEQPERATVCDAALMAALAVLDRNEGAALSTRLTGDALRVYLRDHVAEPVQLAQVAEHFAVSKAHLCRQARPLLGRTVQQEWEAIKLQWAAVLLGEPSLSIAEVARRVGYGDPFYFSRVFRRSVGLSPSNYRKRVGRSACV
ncbi:MAG: AraC family transcriptional regulator [Phycisphaeraceae bacterium]